MSQVILETKALCFMEKIFYPDFQIMEGSILFLTGKSGTGKSTLLHLINGTITQSFGKIYYNGRDTLKMDTIELRRDVCLVSQSVYLFDKSIRDNFTDFYSYREMEVPSDQVMKTYLDLCCISFPLDMDCTHMSGGERQRIYIAIYLSFPSKMIMLDEPTSALDKENSYEVIKNITQYCTNQEITVLIVSHNLELLSFFQGNQIQLGEKED